MIRATKQCTSTPTKNVMIDQYTVKRARQANLVDYLIQRGEPLKRVGANYIHREHDSLYIKDNMFVWYSQDKNGNSVDFLMLYYGMTFKEAVEELTGEQFPNPMPTIKQQQPKRPQSYQRADNEKRVIAYLCKRRGLESNIVFTLIKQGKLWQDVNGNCNFMIADWNERPIGAEIVGTGDTRFKNVTEHSGYGFHMILGEPTEALYFESAIDLLSCYQIYQDRLTHHILVSMGGLNSSVITELKKKRPNLNHWLCVDNDQAGNKLIFKMKSADRNIHIFQPTKQYKDWNEMLLAGQEKK